MKAKITCKECGEQFETGRIPKDRTCPECRKLKRKAWSDYQKQLKREVLDNQKCTECGTTFKAKNLRKNPVCPECRKEARRKHPDNGYCHKCKKIHPKTHRAGDTRLCPECYKDFRRQVKREHIRRKRGSK